VVDEEAVMSLGEGAPQKTKLTHGEWTAARLAIGPVPQTFALRFPG